MKYRKDIDGLRAIAVLTVIFYHAGFSFLSGGFIGVDVFFVISGYLITTIIISEKQKGIFTITNFYERRARRILPALYFIIITSLPFAWLWMYPQQLKDFFESIASVSLFSSNFLFWSESDYFGATAELKPFLHTWSLAIEEQYYVFFPLSIILVWKFGIKSIVVMLSIIGIISLSLSIWGANHSPSASFYLIPTRLWELLIGSFTAILLLYNTINVRKSLNQIMSFLGLCLILYAAVFFDDNTPFPSFYALIPTLGTALIIIFAREKNLTKHFLSNRLFVGIGLISYSAYLWHQPLFAFAKIKSIHEPSSLLLLFLSLLSLILAVLTWKYVEQPFRNKMKFNRKAIFLYTGGISALIISIGFLGHLKNGYPSRISPSGKSFKELDISNKFRVNFGLNQKCEGFTTSELCRTSNNPEIIVWGDSYAMHLTQGILASNPNAKIIQMTKSACGPVLSIAPINHKHSVNWANKCIRINQRVYKWLQGNKSIKYAVLSSPFSQYLIQNGKLKTTNGITTTGQEIAIRSFEKTLKMIEGLGIKPVVISPPPSNGKNIGNCLIRTEIFNQDYNQCNIHLSEHLLKNSETIKFLKKIEKNHKVIWLSTYMCKDNTCKTRIKNVHLYKDEGHLSFGGSKLIGKELNLYKAITR